MRSYRVNDVVVQLDEDEAKKLSGAELVNPTQVADEFAARHYGAEPKKAAPVKAARPKQG